MSIAVENIPVLRPPIFEGVDRVRSGFSLAGERTPERPLGYNMSVVPGVVREGLTLASGGQLEGDYLDAAVAQEVQAAQLRREQLAHELGFGTTIRAIAYPKPVAGADFVEVGLGTIADLTIDSPTRKTADASIITESGYSSLFPPADCPTIDLVDPNTGGEIAQIHAGWQGIVAGVVPTVVDALKARGLNPKHALVNVHPNATEGFELNGDGLVKWRAADLSEFVTERDGTTDISMTDAVVAQLIEAGVPEGRIQTSQAYSVDGKDFNTLTDPRFYSHRNRKINKINGRNAAFLARVGE